MWQKKGADLHTVLQKKTKEKDSFGVDPVGKGLFTGQIKPAWNSQRPSKVPGGRSSCAHYASFQSITWFRTALSSPGWKRIRTIWSALAPVNTLGPRGRGLDSTEPRWFRDRTGAVWLHPQIKPRPTLRQLRHPPTQPLYQVGQFPLCSSAEGWRHPRWQSPFCKVSSDVLASL